MFEELRGFSKIVVTGPQRSGTTIAAEMIGADLGLEVWRHERIPTMGTLVDVIGLCDGFVVQVPHLCRYVHYCEIGARADVAVVLIRRDIADIVASEDRIGWGPYRAGELARYGLTEGVISEVKYDFWESHQRARIHHAFEIAYESLRGHELWVEVRPLWGPRQTRKFEGSASIIIPCLILPDNDGQLLKFTERCVDSIFRYPIQCELIIIDNASPVGGDRLREMCNVYVRNYRNLGFAPAVNQGLKLASREWLVVVNNDVEFLDDWVATAQAAWGPDTGAVSSFLHAHDPEHKAGRRVVVGGEMFGALWMTRRDVVEKVGYLDEGYERGMFEDWDYWKRMEAAGYELVKAGWCNHAGNATWGKLPRQREIFLKNKKRFEEKWGDGS